jgi:tripartite-type tricarboxylate transporter receptor subunit TctC
MKLVRVFLLSCAALLLASHPLVQAQQEPFYQGKTIRVVVGFTSGGFYDRWSRLLARFVPKHLPGNPEMIVQNMPGAGGLIAANHVYNVARPDGLTIGMTSYGMYLDNWSAAKKCSMTCASSNGSARRKRARS